MEPQGTFGPRLRQERERRQISLASIAASTKISKSLLEGLERDDVSRWPSGIFRRSFVRAYAEAIGLDADETVREFGERFPDPADPPPAEVAPEPRSLPDSGAPAGRSPASVRAATRSAPDRVELVLRLSVPRTLASWVSWLTSRVGTLAGRHNS